MNTIEAVLNLFNAIPMNSNGSKDEHGYAEANDKWLRRGLFLAPELAFDLSSVADAEEELEDISASNSDLNRSFHQSFGEVKSASDEELVFQQMFHYLSTYGMEAITGAQAGTFVPVYVPNKALGLAADTKGVPVIVIRGMEKSAIVSETKKLMGMNVALSEKVLDSIMQVATVYGIRVSISKESVPNKELRSRLCDLYGIVPENPQDFLRFVVNKATGKSVIINSREFLSSLKYSQNAGLYDRSKDAAWNSIAKAFNTYTATYGVEKLATVFYRYKKVWLALKSKKYGTAKTINRMRKLADSCKKPAHLGVLDIVTSADVDIKAVEKELAKVSIFKKVSILNAISYRRENPSAIMYRVRNGKAFVTDLKQSHIPSEEVYNAVVDSIVGELRDSVKGKTVYIPSNVSYAFPTSEKSFVGCIPFGSSVEMGSETVVGVLWDNDKSGRVDLDLHMSNVNNSFGWNSSYRDSDGEVLFSGDMTDAANGAVEAYYVGKGCSENYQFELCYYNQYKGSMLPKPYKLILDTPSAEVVKGMKKHKKTSDWDDDWDDSRLDARYIISNQTLLTTVNMEFDGGTQAIGYLDAEGETKKFYFINMAFGYGGVVSRDKDMRAKKMEYYHTYLKSATPLSFLLSMAGANVVSERPTEEDAEYVDLSLAGINKTSILGLVAPAKE